MTQGNNENEHFSDTGFADPQITLSKPSMYKVILLNDDYTPMDFVSLILEKFFNKMSVEANSLTSQIHSDGAAVCGFYTRDIAETKVGIVNEFARQSQHPLKCTFEEDF